MAFWLCPKWHTMTAQSKGLLNDKSAFLFNGIYFGANRDTGVYWGRIFCAYWGLLGGAMCAIGA